jgi:Kef-type K+ transport system membrane component KefB
MMDSLPHITSEVAYLVLIFGLLVVPRALQRLLIPAPLTSFAFGMAAAVFLARFSQDATLALLATLGISSLFLFAGLEVDVRALRRGVWPLLGHLAVRSVMIGAGTWLGVRYLHVSWQVAALLALALLTPSTGFILETLERLGLNDDERFWVMIKAVGSELLALLVLFGVLQSSSPERLAWSSGALAAMIVLLPLLFLLLGRWVIPYAPGSGFSLLVMVGLIAAYLTKELGVYYLVGAFLAGFAARLLRERLPELASEENLHAVRLFASFFVPFYFFYRGMNVPSGALVWESAGLGLAAAAAVLPFRIGSIWVQRRFAFGEDARTSLNVGVALAPTLIFTLVLATILRERFDVPAVWYGALLVYAGISTLLPSLVLSKPFDVDFVGPPWPGPEKAAAQAAAAEAQAASAADAPPASNNAQSAREEAQSTGVDRARPESRIHERTRP